MPNDTKLKICLISPRAESLSRNPKFKAFWDDSPHIKRYRDNWSGIGSGLLILAGLTPPDFDLEIIDENYEAIDFEKSYDLVGITAMTQQINRAYAISERFRQRDIKTVIGGIHVTLLPDEARKHADCVVVGEGETVWPKVIGDFQKGCLKPLYVSDGPVDLKESPVPRFDLLKPRNNPVIWIQTSRGCPRDCEFCAASSVYGKKHRTKTIDQVIQEITFIKERIGQCTIGFGDDNLLVNKRYANELLEALIPLKIRYYAQSDISIAENKALLSLMRQSGCVNVFIGFESVTEAGLKHIDRNGWKYRQLKNYPAYIQKIQSSGIGVMGAFMVGLDSDDTSIFDNVSQFIIDNMLYEAQITISTPLPKTRLWERLEKENRLLPVDWDDYTLCDVTFKHPILSKEELEDGLLSIYQTINAEDIYDRKIQHFTEIYRTLRKQGLKMWGSAR